VAADLVGSSVRFMFIPSTKLVLLTTRDEGKYTPYGARDYGLQTWSLPPPVLQTEVANLLEAPFGILSHFITRHKPVPKEVKQLK
jgi:hypothetical protein